MNLSINDIKDALDHDIELAAYIKSRIAGTGAYSVNIKMLYNPFTKVYRITDNIGGAVSQVRMVFDSSNCISEAEYNKQIERMVNYYNDLTA